MTGWQDDLELHPIAPDRYAATITTAWTIGHFPDGGYVMAAAMRAAGERSRFPDPLTATTTFLRPVEPGPVTIEIDEIRHGRTVSVLAARMTQGGRERNRTIVTFAELAPPGSTGGAAYRTTTPPARGRPSWMSWATGRRSPASRSASRRAGPIR